MNTNNFIYHAISKYNNKYQYSWHDSETGIVSAVCPLHGNFRTMDIYHLKGDECKKCAHGSVEKLMYVMLINGFVKIGVSKNPSARAIMIHESTEIIAVFRFNNPKEIFKKEKKVHRFFKSQNINIENISGGSEFFMINPHNAVLYIEFIGGVRIYND